MVVEVYDIWRRTMYADEEWVGTWLDILPSMKISIRQVVSRSISIGKTAAAAGISWEAAQLTGTHRPYFAPLAAILCLQVTVEESLWQGYQRVLGIVGGVILADIVTRYIGIHGWSIALLVLVGTSVAAMFKLGTKATTQVGVSAMMVLTVGGGHYTYSMDRIVDTVIGAVIAILINMFVFPPNYTPQAKTSVQKATDQLAQRFHAIAEWLDVGASVAVGRNLQDETRTYLEALHQTEDQVHKARQGLRFSPLVRKRNADLWQCEQDLHHLRQGYAHATGTMRTLLEWSDYETMTTEERQHWVTELHRVADVITDWPRSGTPSTGGKHSQVPVHQPSTGETDAHKLKAGVAVDPNRFRYALYNDTHQLFEDFGQVPVAPADHVVK
jgi:hypothetical protein